MKKYVVTAAALMFGTSALAWAPTDGVYAGAMQAGTVIGAMSVDKAPLEAAAFDGKGAMKAQTAAYEGPVAWTAREDSKKAIASLDETFAEIASWDAKAETGMGGPLEPVGDAGKEAPAASEDHGAMDHSAMDHGAMGHGGATPADAQASAKPEMTAQMAAEAEAAAAAKPAATETSATPGVGGPVEARTDYPPCRPGRGDDNCIQLYERGVMSGRKD